MNWPNTNKCLNSIRYRLAQVPLRGCVDDRKSIINGSQHNRQSMDIVRSIAVRWVNTKLGERERGAHRMGEGNEAKKNDADEFRDVKTQENGTQASVRSAGCWKVVRCDHNHSYLRECLGLLSASLSVLVDTWAIWTVLLSSRRRPLVIAEYSGTLLSSDEHIARLRSRFDSGIIARKRINLYEVFEVWCDETSACPPL